MSDTQDFAQMTLAELNSLSAKLYDDYYTLKDKIKRVDRLRNAKMQEEQARRALEAAQSQLDEAQKAQAPEIKIVPDSIESDEAVQTQIPKWREWIARICKKQAIKS